MSRRRRNISYYGRLDKEATATLHDKVVRCPSKTCHALNSPNAQECWKCGAEITKKGGKPH